MAINALSYIGVNSDKLDDWHNFAVKHLGMQKIDNSSKSLSVRPHSTGSMPCSSSFLNTSSAFSLVIIIHLKFSNSSGVGLFKLSFSLGTSFLNISNCFTPEQLVRDVIRISDRRTLTIDFRLLCSILFFFC